MTAEATGLGTIIEALVRVAWETKGTPYYLSSLAPALKEQGKNYRDLIGEERLKSAVRRLSESHDFKVIEHPSQKAKIGLVPRDAAFEFPVAGNTGTVDNQPGITTLGIASQQHAKNFLEAIRRLPPEMLQGIVIPAQTLARLLNSQ